MGAGADALFIIAQSFGRSDRGLHGDAALFPRF